MHECLHLSILPGGCVRIAHLRCQMICSTTVRIPTFSMLESQTEMILLPVRRHDDEPSTNKFVKAPHGLLSSLCKLSLVSRLM